MGKRNHSIEQILESYQAIKRHLEEGFFYTKGGLITAAQGLVLHFVIKYKQSNVKEIAKHLFITSSAATQLIDGLVKKGFLERESDPNDRRSVTLKLTKKARKRVFTIKEKRLEKLNKVFSALNDRELKKYIQLNQKVSTALTK